MDRRNLVSFLLFVLLCEVALSLSSFLVPRHNIDAKIEQQAEAICEELEDIENQQMKYGRAVAMLSSDIQALTNETSLEQDQIMNPDGGYESNEIPEFNYDYGYVVRVVGAEARGEPFECMMAVAQCIQETAQRTGMTPEEVVKVPNQYAPPVPIDCNDNMETVNEACLLVFAVGERAVDDSIEYFCSVGTKSRFHNSLRFVCTIGNMNFYSAN